MSRSRSKSPPPNRTPAVERSVDRGADSRAVVGSPDAAALNAAKAVSVGHSLLRAARLWNEEAIARVRVGAFPTARISHTQVLPHLDLDGTRLTELARRMDVTKQAAQELINELEAAGIVERVQDPSDGRAKLIRFSERGRRALLEGLDVLSTIEGELRAELGDSTMGELGVTLGRLLGFLDALAAKRAEPAPSEHLPEPKGAPPQETAPAERPRRRRPY